MPRVYSYARWSTPEQASGDSKRRQLEAANQWAAARGYLIDESRCVVDEARSAYRGDNALDGGLSCFLRACREGRVEPGSFLVVESLDRISRMVPRRAQRLIDDIVDSGVTIVTLCDNQWYTAERLDSDPTALLLALLVAWRAHEESRTKARRLTAAWAEKRRLLRLNPQKRFSRRAPSWLLAGQDGSWKENPTKSAIVRRVFAMTLCGIGEHRIAATFNQEGVATLGRGIRWHRSTVAKLLRNVSVIGKLTPGRMEYSNGRRQRVLEAPVDGAFPAIVSVEDWKAVRALKDTAAGVRRRCTRGNDVAHYLAGLATCPKCGSGMHRVNKGPTKKSGRPKLVCGAARAKAGCSYVSVRIEDVERALAAHLNDLFQEHSNLNKSPQSYIKPPSFDSSSFSERNHADTNAVNSALKIAFERVVIDYVNGTLHLKRRSGGELIISYVRSPLATSPALIRS